MMNKHLEAFVSYHPIFKRKHLWAHDPCIINPYFNIDFCKYDACTILPASVGLTPTNAYFEAYFHDTYIMH